MYIRIGTRSSMLSLIQTNIIIEKIKKLVPRVVCKIIPIITSGDKIQDKNLYDIGGKALFLKDIEQKLQEKKIDMAVHSMKDVPAFLPKGLLIAAVSERLDARDVFVSLKYKTIDEIPEGGVIGSSSVRRKKFIEMVRPDIKFCIFRGNVQTRLDKLKQDNNVDATILAAAGLKRMNLFDKNICHYLTVDKMIPAIGQGVISVEISESSNDDIKNICAAINHIPTWHLMSTERAFLSYFNADCNTPLAAYAQYQDNKIKASYMFADTNSNNFAFYNDISTINESKLMSIRAAKAIKDKIGL